MVNLNFSHLNLGKFDDIHIKQIKMPEEYAFTRRVVIHCEALV